MYDLFLGMQYLSLFMYVVVIGFAVIQRESKLKTILILYSISGLINCAGYILEMQSQTREAAIVAVKCLYLGKPFVILTMFLYTMEFCKIRLQRPILVGMTLFHALISLLVFTCEKHKLYYSEIGFSKKGLFPHLVVSHGIIYQIYMIFIFLTIGFCMIATLRFCFTVDTKEEKVQAAFILLTFFCAAISYGVFLSRATKGYDTTSFAYLIGGVFLCIAIVRYRLVDTLTLAKERVLEQSEQGMVVLNQYHKVVYINSVARQIISEIPMTGDNKCITWIEKNCQLGNEMHIGSKVYVANVERLTEASVDCGQVLYITDISGQKSW